MTRSMVLLCGSGLLSMALCYPASAHGGPLCARPDVLSFAAEHLRQTNAHLTLLADSAIEAPSSNANVVLCVVTVQIRVYDLMRYQQYPAVIWEPCYFAVKQLGDGFVVDFTGR